MRVKPVDPTAVILDPHTKMRLPAEGGDVPENLYWHTRLLHGEVVVCEAPAAPAQTVAAEVSEAKPEPAPVAPTGREPVQPLTTREAK